MISLHAPGEQRIVDEDWLRRVRPGLILVNTARADLVDEAALAVALRDGRVAAYAADTLASEGRRGPKVRCWQTISVDRVTVTPHSAAQTVEAVDLMGAGCGRSSPGRVDCPVSSRHCRRRGRAANRHDRRPHGAR